MISFYYRNLRLRYPSLKKFPGPGGDPPTPTICKYCVAARHNTCRWGFSGKNTCRPHLFYLQRLFGGLATDPRLLAKYLPGASRKCKHCSPLNLLVRRKMSGMRALILGRALDYSVARSKPHYHTSSLLCFITAVSAP